MDSECVLHWMKTTKPLHLFVTTEIQKNKDVPYGANFDSGKF